ncbi:hypothetical protein EYS14_10215 [Alteromonadaceae bacterium M269]|nr:hypothetical protein EYS14_10215 [Alteromonadaceae bacterium M269]
MAKDTFGQSSATHAISVLVRKIHDASSVGDSLYEQATTFFEKWPAQEEKLERLTQEHKAAVEQATKDKKSKDKVKQADVAKRKVKAFQQELTDERETRLRNMLDVCKEALSLVEAHDTNLTNSYSAKVLGTLLLLNGEGPNLAQRNQKAKHLYKGILALRLLDKLLLEDQITNTYVLSKYKEKVVSENDSDKVDFEHCPFRRDVQIPLLMAALIQDIGNYHPDAQAILKGKEGDLDEFRMLDLQQRKALLKIGYEQGMRYTKEGLGVSRYIGNSRDEREAFNKNELDKLVFLRTLLKSALSPQHGIGNLLKIPQVYASVVLSTKANHEYCRIPKVNLVLKKGAENKAFSHIVVDYFIQITGTFPQGFGITYIPKDADKNELDRYEYGVVIGLYPSNPDAPLCRAATRNLTFNSFGMNYIVSKSTNLYFSQARKKLEKVSESRLREILSKLWSNYDEKIDLELIPACWQPHEYFSYKKHQNLWNKATTFRN